MHANHHERRGKRSRLLGSIFAPAPHSAPLSGETQNGAHRGSHMTTCAGIAVEKRKTAKRHGWRDVTASLTRAEIAESICTRFFAAPRQDDREVCAGRLDGGMATAGQRLQALSTERQEGELTGIDLAALLRGLGRDAKAAAASQAESAGASLQSLQTAKAA